VATTKTAGRCWAAQSRERRCGDRVLTSDQ
jgi:hypothetical protein